MDQSIHIVHIIPRLVYGGAERSLVLLTNQLADRRIRQTIVTFFADNVLASELSSQVDVQVVPKHSRLDLRYIVRLRKVLRKLGPSIVHTHLGGDIWGRLAAYKLGVPIVTTEHSVRAGEGGSRTIRWVKRVLRSLSTIYICPSEAIMKALEQVYRIKKEQCVVIPHGIDLAQFSLPVALPSVPFRFGIIGRLAPEKGHEVALRALSMVTELPWQLSVVGEGSEEQYLKQLASSLGIAERVSWQPFTRDVLGVLRHVDIVLAPSLWEGLGIGIMEAMAAGRVVIASDVGGIPELITHNQTGKLAVAGDVDAWVEAIRNCYHAVDELGLLAVRAQQYATQYFSYSTMIDRYEAMYRSLLN